MLVALFFVPVLVPVTLRLNVHEPPPASVALPQTTLALPATAASVPLPTQLPPSALGVDTTRPAGKGSVKPIPVNAVDALGLAMMKVSEVDPFSAMLAAPNAIPIVGGAVATTAQGAYQGN